MPKIQIVSDTHLEFRGDNFKKLIKPNAPILFLLGDICACGTDEDFEIYKRFITFLAPQFKYIFHVPGNHEYYTNNRNIALKDSIPGVDAKLRKFTKTFTNVFFLNNNTIRLTLDKHNYVFIGTTLWTNIRPENRPEVGKMMNDYENIWVPSTKPKTESEKLTWKPFRKYNIDDMSKLHVKSVKYVIGELKKIKANEIPILLTHHKPVRDKPMSDIRSQAYETDLVNIIIKKPFVLAGHGHTHAKYDKKVNGVRIVSNPKGYISEHTSYDPTFIVSV